MFNYNVKAQQLQKPFRKLGTRDGLPQSYISGLVQDKDGFVWIGTRNGLVRYDGRRFKLFQHNSRDTASLSSNLIITLVPGKNNQLYIEHEVGEIDCINTTTNELERVTARPLFRLHPALFLRRGWLFDASGDLWCTVGGDGIYHYQWQQNSITHYTRQSQQLINDTIIGLLQDRNQQLWIASPKGISRFDSAANRFQHFLFPASYQFYPPKAIPVDITAMHQRPNGEIMLGDRRQLVFFDPVKKTFRNVLLPDTTLVAIHYLQTGPDGKQYFENSGLVYSYEERNGIKAVGDIGISTFRNATSFLVDRSGLIWLGTNAAGLYQVDVNAPYFESHPGEIPFHYHLLKKEFGLALNEFADWPLTDGNFNLSSYFFRSAYDRQHNLWIALRNKVARWDAASKSFTSLPPVPGIVDSQILTWGIRGLSFAPNGTLWITGDKGYIGYYDTLKRQWQTFLEPAVLQKRFKTEISLVDLVADEDKLWITSGTGEGLITVDLETRNIRQINQQTAPGVMPTNLILDLQPDLTNKNILWVGSYEGLVRLDKNTLQSTFFSIEQGLPDNTVYSIQTDSGGFLWLSTNQGLCRFHPVTHAVRVFKTENGLPGNEFNRFNHITMPDGRLAFGGLDGWVIFNPSTVGTDDYQPQISLTGLKIYNEVVTHTSDEKLLPKPLNQLDQLQLTYSQNTVTFEFAGLQYNQPSALHYRYRLQEYDREWIYTASPIATYTQLPPGHYSLHINCTNTVGKWSNHTKVLELVVLPPWWQTGWAYLLYALIIGAIIYGLYRTWMQRHRAKQQILLQQQEAAQLRKMDDMKSRFFSNITHEFRTPLSLIIAPLDAMLRKGEAPEKGELSGVYNNAKQLLHLVNQSLDMAKLEADSMKITLYRGNITTFAQQQTDAFTSAASAKKIRINFLSAITNDEEYLFDADKLHTILCNLLSNAVKFTPSGGSVEVALEQREISPEQSCFTISVKDSGIGIAADKQPHIFNRFYQATDNENNHYGGTGIGLSLAKELAELMGGTLTVSSQPGIGSLFTLTLVLQKPADNSAPVYTDAAPLADATCGQIKEAETTPPEVDASLPLILVVEDNPELNAFIARSFRQQYRVLTAADGIEGLEVAKETMPDVIISDWMMPGLDGVSFCREIKNNLATSHIAFVQLTARSAPGSRIEGLQSGADDYLTKPFITEELHLRVANLLERQRILRQKLQTEIEKPAHQNGNPAKESDIVTNLFLQKIYALVEERLDDTAFGVDEIATGVGMSRANLHRKLKAVAGVTPGSIIRNYRLQRAAQYLQEGCNSSETAYKTGFETPAYFTKCFREFYGLTPTDYLKSI